ncbi:MAG: hypothetical protein AB1Z98_05720 [Nannocystaceae bacterium]
MSSEDDERQVADGDDPKPLWQRLAYPRPPLWYRVAQVLLPPLLVAGAVGVHWWLNVPDKILESKGDQGAKKNKKKARNKKKPRSPARERARSPEELEADWEAWRGTPFDDEPTRSVWARRNQALVNRAMVIALEAAFEGAPEKPRAVLETVKCRTVRCRFVLRSPYAHELDGLAEALEGLESGGQPVWRSFESATVEAPEGLPSHEHYVQVTVGLQRESTDTRTLETPAPTAGESDSSAGDSDGGGSEGAPAEGDAPPKP